MVILSTPQGEFTVSYGTTTLGATIPPRADTHFRIAMTEIAGAISDLLKMRSGLYNYTDAPDLRLRWWSRRPGPMAA